MVVVGIDPSLTATGVASSEGWVEVLGEAGITNMSWKEQDDAIGDLVTRIVDVVVKGGPPDLVIIEALDMSNSYGGTIERTVLWWSVVKLLSYRGIRVLTAASTIGKMYATGNGNAKKGEVIAAVTRQWPQYETKGNDNAADAVAFCALAAHSLGQPFSAVAKTQERAVVRTKTLDERPPQKKRKTPATNA